MITKNLKSHKNLECVNKTPKLGIFGGYFPSLEHFLFFINMWQMSVLVHMSLEMFLHLLVVTRTLTVTFKTVL